MPSFSRKSDNHLRTAHQDLIEHFQWVVKWFDCTILQGHRGEEAQNAAADAVPPRSKVRWPKGKHNAFPSNAVDAGPYTHAVRGVDWNTAIVAPTHRHLVSWKAVRNLCRFYYFAGFVLGSARARGLRLRWGGDWDGDRYFDDQKFNDLVHFERKPD